MGDGVDEGVLGMTGEASRPIREDFVGRKLGDHWGRVAGQNLTEGGSWQEIKPKASTGPRQAGMCRPWGGCFLVLFEFYE